ncbi:MAG: tetratricopeptide repeat protein [Rhodobacterales bacterium]|nr:tetratricopeptide repeat protein [Rhodobacterales bacterium]
MNAKLIIAKPIVAALVATVMISLPFAGNSGENPLEGLYDELQLADSITSKRLSRQIRLEWSKSGSATMDILLKRGRDAMEKDDFTAAVDHFSALIDHAPDFAEGWHARATAHFRASNYGLAIADLEQTIALNDRHFGAIYGLAVILEELGRFDDAYDSYSAVLNVFPTHAKALEALARLETQVNGVSL